MCTTSFHPPLEKYYFASVRGLASNRSERPCLAARTLLLADFAIGLPPQCRDLCQILCTRFSPVRYRQISSTIAGTALYSRFGGYSGGAQLRGRGGRVCPSPGQPRRFSRATIKRSLRAGTCVCYNYSIQLVAIWRARVPKRNNIFLEGGWKLVVHIAVYPHHPSIFR